jgi:hypoxanthine phosphoribosyltransferase
MEYKILFTNDQIVGKVKELAGQIAEDYKDQHPILVCVLNGGFIFFSDLSKALWNAGLVNFEVDFVRISSYGDNKVSSGNPIMTKDVEINVQGRDVIIVDDIIETGNTPRFLIDHLSILGPSSIKLCTLLSKPLRKKDIEPDYLVFEVSPEDWVEGYGLDTASLGRGRDCIIKRI